MRSIFAVGGPYVGVDQSTRRALGQLDLEHQEVLRIVAACKELGLKPETPVWKNDVCSHVGIPDRKVAIVARKSMDSAYYDLTYRKWANHGWDLLAVTHRQTQMLTDAQLTAHLKSAMRELGKSR